MSYMLLRSCHSFLGRGILQETKTSLVQKCGLRNEAPKVKGVFGVRTEPKLSLKERLLKPTSGAPFAFGRAAVTAGSGLGLGALCFYGLASRQDAIIDKSLAWPKHVQDRIHATFAYFGASIGVAATSAYFVTRTPALMRLVSSNSLLAFGVTIAALIGLGSISASIPYSPGFGPKQMAWLAHSSLLGAIIAPISVVGGPLIMRAALMTAGVISSLSLVAVCAPSEKFLNIGGPLAMGFGLVFASSLATMFLAPTSAIGASAYSISIYGGLLLFSAFLLYDVQKIVKRAEHTPLYGTRPYDPIQNSMAVFIDTLNIFTRILAMLGMGGQKKK